LGSENLWTSIKNNEIGGVKMNPLTQNEFGDRDGIILFDISSFFLLLHLFLGCQYGYSHASPTVLQVDFRSNR
jgi:hypothetical protein